MTNSSEGWSLAEAFRRTVGPEEPDTCDDQFWTLVVSGSLIAYGRQEPASALEWISPDICKTLLFRDYRKSTAGASDSRKRPFADLRIFPLLGSPKAMELLDGMSLKDTFDRFLLHDPEVDLLGRRAIEAEPCLRSVYVNGHCHPNGAAEWPLGGLKFGVAGGIPDGRYRVFHARPPGPPPSEASQVAARAITSRYSALLELLRRGILVATGYPTRTGISDQVLQPIWSHPDFCFDAWQGDICEYSDEGNTPRIGPVPRWKAVMLHAANTPLKVSRSSPISGRWLVKTDLTKGEQAILAIVRELFPAGLAAVSTTERNKKIQQFQEARGDFRRYADQTIKRCIKKIEFEPI